MYVHTCFAVFMYYVVLSVCACVLVSKLHTYMTVYVGIYIYIHTHTHCFFSVVLDSKFETFALGIETVQISKLGTVRKPLLSGRVSYTPKEPRVLTSSFDWIPVSSCWDLASDIPIAKCSARQGAMWQEASRPWMQLGLTEKSDLCLGPEPQIPVSVLL